MEKKVRGYTAVMNGDELWVNTESDEMITIVVKDTDLRWALYCKNIEITIKVLEPIN